MPPLTRRSLLLAMAPRPAAFRWAICSETSAGLPFPAACRAAARCGYAGIEVEPAHLGPDPVQLSAAERKQVRQHMASAGLRFTGFHNALKAPAGLHLTSADPAQRARSWDYLRGIIDLAADLGPSPLIAFGSSRQRNALPGVSPAEATQRLADGLAALAPHARSRGVTISLEPLAPHLCNIIQTLAEALAVVQPVQSPALQTMFDTHNAVAETVPHAVAVRQYKTSIRHVHLNELDGRYPGAADYPFLPILQALRDIRYPGWVSVEVFDFKPDGETVARLALEHLRKLEASLP